MTQKEDKKETWVQTHWRPMIAYVYLLIILFDFIIGPIFWTLAQFYGAGAIAVQWVPITLGAGGLFHATICAVLGVSAYTRGSEKIERIKHREDE